MSYNEADTIAKRILPALYANGWTEDHLRREENAGGIDIINGQARRSRKRADLTLRIKTAPDAQPVAVALIEAKAESLPPMHGLDQGKLYAGAKRLNVPFVYATNGHRFVEYDRFTGQTSAARPMDEFPSPDDLKKRYEQHQGFKLDEPAARPLVTRYAGAEEGARRYYQDAAIRAVLEKLARGDKRALLTLATGSGKTRIAVNLLKRLADAGQLKRALFVCDRDELRTQAMGAFMHAFGNDAAPASGSDPQTNARIVVATYQTLDIATEEADANYLMKHYPPDYFTHIVIDECHRSAWGKWSQVLTRNPNAVQIGLTATPRQLKIKDHVPATPEIIADAQITADNIAHFGEPVYEYDIAQGIADGYLAACEIRKGRVNIDPTGLTRDEVSALRPVDPITGELLTADALRDRYEKGAYESELLLPDRVQAMCQDLFSYLLETGGPEQKTIIFCVRDAHADAVASTMNNLYAEWQNLHGAARVEPYAFKCTAAGGGDALADLRGSNHSHFIAATVDLLSTGVDVPAVRNIVFFRYVRSPIAFYQMVGRGTRIDVPTEKLMFRIYDYTDATDLFGEDFIMPAPTEPGEGSDQPDNDRPERKRPPQVEVEGIEVRVTDAGHFILTNVDGKAMPVAVEVYKQALAERLVAQVATLDAFREKWIVPDERQALLDALPDGERSARLVRTLDDRAAYDLFDVLGELAYGLNGMTREQRVDAFEYKHGEWLATLPDDARRTVLAFVAQFRGDGTDALENAQIFQIPAVKAAGGLRALRAVYPNPADIILDVRRKVFVA
jgi:type I restriction enzyme R subunit